MARSDARGLGKRELKTRDRNDAIRKAALALARRRKWPSPPAIAERTGISQSVIERETALLLDARREWERVTGTKHPQWRDPEPSGTDAGGGGAVAVKEDAAAGDAAHAAAGSDGEGMGAVGQREGGTMEPGSDAAERLAEKAQRDRRTMANQRQTIARLKDKVAELEEQVRRLLIGVRPPELGLILEAGAPKRRKGKAKKRVAVGP